MSHFDETSGSVPCPTPWGHWYQTVEEVYVLVDLPAGTKANRLDVRIRPESASVSLDRAVIFAGKWSRKIQADESVWTLEDNRLLRIQLVKVIGDPTHPDCCWPGLLEDQFLADPMVKTEMEKKLTLQRFALEHPGFDFSNSDITGEFTSGGPRLPSTS